MISILTTVYNGEIFLEKTIKSVLNQTFKDFEYIIVDDGSTDKTKEIIKEFKDKRIKYFYAGKNKGYYHFHNAINLGLGKCQGKYIARIDSDDLMNKNRLQVQYDYLEKNKDIFMIGSSVNVIDKNGSIIDIIMKKSYPSIFYKGYIAFSNSFIHSSIMFRNKGLKYPYYNEHFFYFAMLEKGYKIKNIKDILTNYRINPNGVIVQDTDLTNNKYKEYYLGNIKEDALYNNEVKK